MNEELCNAQNDVLSWCQNNFNKGTYQVVTHHDLEDEAIVVDISQPSFTDKNIAIMCVNEGGSYGYDCRVESKEGCEYEFNHEKFSLSETLSHAKNWIEENKENTTLKLLSGIVPMGSVAQDYHSEMIARNILLILLRTKGIFRLLSWEDYVIERKEDGNFSDKEKRHFDNVIEYTTSSESCSNFSPKWDLKA